MFMQDKLVSTPPATPARPGGRGAAAEPPRLEERTSSDADSSQCPDAEKVDRAAVKTRARIRRYPDGGLEVTVVRRPPTKQLRKICGRQSANGAECQRTVIEQIEDYARSATRAQSTVRRLIQAGGLDHMLTLTYRENRTDARQCDADLTRFLRLVRDGLQKDYPYVAVFERQKRGAGH
jgi:hypothetical protein